MGAVAELHEVLGWPKELIEVETKDYVFDFAVFRDPDRSDHMLIAGEAKASKAQLDDFVSFVRECGVRGPHELADHETDKKKTARQNAHKKYAALLRSNPPYLWAVAPEKRRCLKVSCGGGLLWLAEIGETPPGRAVLGID